MRTVARIAWPRSHSSSSPRLGILNILLVAGSVGLFSCRWKEAGVAQPAAPWEKIPLLAQAPDSTTIHQVESILLWATDSLAPPGDPPSRWNVYCHDDISWNRKYRIVGDVHPTWMDDSWYVEIAFPTGPGLRLHFGNPGIATPVYSDWRDSLVWIPDGNSDTVGFNRRKLPCSRRGPTDFRGRSLSSPVP